MRAVLCVLVAIPLAACGDPDPREDPPDAPSENDPAYDLDGDTWYLIGNDLTPAEDTLTLRVEGPGSFVDAWIDGAPGVRLVPVNGGFELEADIAELGPGDHEVLLAADGKTTAFASFPFIRSHPMYFLASTDWDFSDPTDVPLDMQDRLHDEHPNLLITQFVGPYTFTDPAVSDEREDEIVAWVKKQRDDYGDEIALHIHPWCHFVEYAGLTCITDQSSVGSSDETGYAVRLEPYGDANFRTLLETADELFMERGLGKPVTFRAGGWTATIETLHALAATGYIADTSALNWARMEEWKSTPQRPSTLYEWNMAHWAPINDTSQPYYPNEDDVLTDDDPTLSILEVPDNSIMVDYVNIGEMQEIFDANGGGGALDQPKSFMMGWHPSENWTLQETQRIYGIVEYAEQYLASRDKGPVVFALLRDMPKVWKQP